VADLEQRWHDLGAFIREQRLLEQRSLRGLSEMAGISNPYLSQIERGLRRPSAEILQQIARALEISAETLYVRAGILDEPGDGPDVVGEIRRDPSLDEDQKKTLIHIYESFRSARAELDALADPGTAAGAGADAVADTEDGRDAPGEEPGLDRVAPGQADGGSLKSESTDASPV
jgi:transcriptional regulator with XRE-family HTH domain